MIEVNIMIIIISFEQSNEISYLHEIIFNKIVFSFEWKNKQNKFDNYWNLPWKKKTL